LNFKFDYPYFRFSYEGGFAQKDVQSKSANQKIKN